MPIAAIISFILKNSWARYALEALAIAACLFVLYASIEAHGFSKCKAEYVARDNAAALDFQKRTTDALSMEMLASTKINQSHAALTRTIGASHDTTDDALAPAIIRSSIDGLYSAPLRP